MRFLQIQQRGITQFQHRQFFLLEMVQAQIHLVEQWLPTALQPSPATARLVRTLVTAQRMVRLCIAVSGLGLCYGKDQIQLEAGTYKTLHAVHTINPL